MKKLQRILLVLLAGTVLACLCVVCVAVDEEGVPKETEYAGTHTHDWYYTWDEGLYAYCYGCDACASVQLCREYDYSYCPGEEIFPTIWVEETDWIIDDFHPALGYGDTSRLMHYRFTYSPADEDDWQIGVPSKPGTYKAAVCMDEYTEVEDISGDYGSFETCVTVHIGHRADDEWKADGQSLSLACRDCGRTVAEITLSEDAVKGICADYEVTPNVKTWFIDEEMKNTVTLPDYCILYKGTGETDYPLSAEQPDAYGTYTMCLAICEDPDDSGTVKTEPCRFTVTSHSWSYYTYEYALYAECTECGEHAEVCIDTSTVYEASRTYNGRNLDYEVFYEKNWSCQDGIEPYAVLFTGKETKSETSTTEYDHAFVKPRTTGNYNVRIALLKDPDDPDTAWLSTKEKVYYLADISINECEVLAYGPTQIAQFTEPELSDDGYYLVGTTSELLWCLSKGGLDADISLTNDIVVNPITVNEDGEIRCARYQIYKWSGFGTEKKPYTGNINGNGYTVYGLYQPDSSVHYNGFVANGQNCLITDLTVENSVLYGTDAAAIVGHYDHTSSDDGKILNCRNLSCYFSGTSTCGGIVSWLTSSPEGSMSIYGCSSDSIICGAAAKGAGGIVGRAAGADALYIQWCSNLGPVTSNSGMAGGLIGYADLEATVSYIAVWDSFNIGSVTCPNYVGGIVGYIKDYKGNEEIYFDNCTSTGYLSAGSNVGGIAGYISTGQLYDRRYPTYGNFYYNAKVAYKTADQGVSLENNATKLTKGQANGNFICSRYGHTPCSHRTAESSASCTKDGKLMLQCAVCNATMESETIRAYGHHYEYGECVYCGVSEDEDEGGLFGTIFGNPPISIAAAASALLLLLMAGYLILKRKKRIRMGH